VAAEEHFAQLRLALEKEINEAHAKCHELERLRFATAVRARACTRRRHLLCVVCVCGVCVWRLPPNMRSNVCPI
jgi:hypothetical protein